MTDLERVELALRRVYAGRDWNTSTIDEFIHDLIGNLTELNNYHSIFDKEFLEEERK